MIRRTLLRGALAVGLLALTGVLSAPARAAAPAAGDASVDAIVDGVMDRVFDYGDLHWHEGEYNHLVALYKLVGTAQPYRYNAYADAAYLLWSMDRDREAVDLLRIGLKHNPNTYYFHDEIGRYYILGYSEGTGRNHVRKKDYARAVPHFERASRFKDCTAASLHSLANCYEKVNQPEKALAIWRRASRFPNDAIAKRRAERLEKQLGRSNPQ